MENDKKGESPIERKWDRIKNDFRKRYRNVSETDATYKKGEFGKMLGKLQERTGKSREYLQNEIENWEKS